MAGCRAASSTGRAPGAATGRTWPCRRRCSATCRRRARPGACARRGRARTPSACGFLDHDRQLGRLLDHDEGLQAELAADQRQADVLAVLVAVADDEAAGPASASTAISSGLVPASRPKPSPRVRRQLAGHAEVLVDLDRIDRGVAAACSRSRPCACAKAACSLRRRSPRMSEKRTSSGSLSAVGAWPGRRPPAARSPGPSAPRGTHHDVPGAHRRRNSPPHQCGIE